MICRAAQGPIGSLVLVIANDFGGLAASDIMLSKLEELAADELGGDAPTQLQSAQIMYHAAP